MKYRYQKLFQVNAIKYRMVVKFDWEVYIEIIGGKGIRLPDDHLINYISPLGVNNITQNPRRVIREFLHRLNSYINECSPPIITIQAIEPNRRRIYEKLLKYINPKYQSQYCEGTGYFILNRK